MSLYCFGKLRLVIGESLSAPLSPGIWLGKIDPDDCRELDAFPELSGEGTYFSIRDSETKVDATTLWIEAMDKGTDRILHTGLGRAVHSLMFSPSVHVGGIAFVDGGIQTILRGTSDQCWEWFRERSMRPWDDLDNPLLIWMPTP